MRKTKELPAVIRTRALYRVDYFKGPVLGANWIGKELFHAVDLPDAVRLGNKRGTQLGYNVFVSLHLE